MRGKFIGAMFAAAMVAGLTGCGSSEGIGTGATTVSTQATETQREEAGDDTKGEDEKEDLKVSDSKGASDFHIGIVADSVFQSENDRRGVEASRAIYDKDTVRPAIYPGNFIKGLEATVQTVINLSDDPKMKAIIMNQSVSGTIETFHKIKEIHPDILYTADEGHEDLPEVSSAAGLVYNNDFVVRNYLVIRTAHELGYDTSVYISFPRHITYETVSRRVAIIREACKELDMGFALETAPDPTPDVGVADAQTCILKKIPEWVEKYSKDATYFCVDDTHAEPSLRQFMKYDGYFVGTDLPSLLMGYPGTLGIDLAVEAGGFDKILVRVESTIVERGDTDHFRAWAYFYGYTASAGLTQHTLSILNDESELNNIDGIAEAYQVFSPKAEWGGSNYTNVGTDVKLDNVFLVYQDTYIMGNLGYFMGSTKIEVPEKYFTVK